MAEIQEFNPRADFDNGKPVNKELLNWQLSGINKRLDSIDSKLDGADVKYVSRREFDEMGKDLAFLQKLLYGAIGLILLEFLRVVSSYFIKPPQ